MAKGVLTLIPTPIDEEHPLEGVAFKTLVEAFDNNRDNSLFVVEDHKPGRRRWIHFGLPREAINDFVLYNEHNYTESAKRLLTALQKGKNVFLMSDGGMPAFCDPGRLLVEMCHAEGIKVTATPFPNSVILALALSGFNHDEFLFKGFIPIKEGREKAMADILAEKRTVIFMDTPYRLHRTLEELNEAMKKNGKQREIFVAMDLNAESEECYRMTPSKLLNKIKEFKREFVVVC